ncbi:ECs_2282 family putative zinc-binding protein, partial [Escherichia coli]
MNTIKFSCPECGGEVFDTSFKPQGSDSFAGAICKNCGHLVTEDESSQFDDEIV